MPDSICNFVWYELMTSDTAAATDFYRTVIGWNTRDAGYEDKSYTVLSAGDYGVGGIMAIPEHACEAGSRPGWAGYIWVPDTDAYAARIVEKGGKIHRAPDDIPTIGRFAVVADPGGAVFMLITPIGEAPATRPAADTPGLTGWRELYAWNGEEAMAWYGELFGFQQAGGMDMGPMGEYKIFSAAGEPVAIGGIMNKPEQMPATFWQYYFNVEEINSAIERVKSNGGQICMGPHEVPGGSWIVQCLDPQGAAFALVAPKAAVS